MSVGEVELADFALSENIFDVCFFDEATELKNSKCQTSRQLSGLKSTFRVALTGTPIMNNLTELYNIVDFVIPGYLGDRRRFGDQYGKPIAAAQLSDADCLTRKMGIRCLQYLHDALTTVALRYTKEQLHALEASKHEILVWVNPVGI